MNEVVTYTYDSWGNPLGTGGSLASTVGAVNPFRYRGYCYDGETGLYYLQSRYYDPNTGRFLNADDTDILGANHENLVSENLFAYCENSPVMEVDPNGDMAGAVLGLPLLGLGPIGIAAYVVIVVAAFAGTAYMGYLSYKAARQYIYYAKSRNKPVESGTPYSSKKDRNGYTTYGRNGEVRKQVRLKGKPHGNIKRPNVKLPRYNRNPKTGKTYRNGWKVRKPWKWELPKGFK